MAEFEQALADLRAEVAEAKTVNASAKALLEKIPDLMRASADDAAAIRALADELSAETDALAAAVAQGTEAEDEGAEGEEGTDPQA